MLAGWPGSTVKEVQDGGGLLGSAENLDGGLEPDTGRSAEVPHER